tara:strand:+ start:206 stop:700 length:495 start_codon:yes stop_codon:yes gene_type:complete
MTDTNNLNDKWDLYYHLPTDSNWEIDSYKPIMQNIINLSQINEINTKMEDGVIKNCMLFLMRTGITPRWEDKKNRKGGCFSYKIHNKFVANVWRDVFSEICKESYCNDKSINKHINGITISPKKNFCILKVWFDCIEYQNPNIFKTIQDISNDGCLFKEHTPEN